MKRHESRPAVVATSGSAQRDVGVAQGGMGQLVSILGNILMESRDNLHVPPGGNTRV